MVITFNEAERCSLISQLQQLAFPNLESFIYFDNAKRILKGNAKS